MATGSYLSVITLNVNGLNAPTKRQRLAEWIQKQDPYICCLQETHLKTGDTYRLKVKGWKKIFHANRDQKKAGVAILISDKIDFITKAVKRDKDGHYIMIKGSIQEEDITIINIYAPNIGAPQYVRQMLTSMKGEINNNTIIVGDFNTPLTPMDRSTKQKINKETQTLNDTLDQLDLIDIYRTFHPKTTNFTFFSSAHGTFSRIDHILGHKSKLDKFKKIEIIPSIFSDHNALRLDLNYRRKTIKNSNIWRLNNTLLNNQQITEEIKKEIKICIEMNENENTTTQNLWAPAALDKKDNKEHTEHGRRNCGGNNQRVNLISLSDYIYNSVRLNVFNSGATNEHSVGVDAVRCAGDECAIVLTGNNVEVFGFVGEHNKHLVNLICNCSVENSYCENIAYLNLIKVGEKLCGG